MAKNKTELFEEESTNFVLSVCNNNFTLKINFLEIEVKLLEMHKKYFKKKKFKNKEITQLVIYGLIKTAKEKLKFNSPNESSSATVIPLEYRSSNISLSLSTLKLSSFISSLKSSISSGFRYSTFFSSFFIPSIKISLPFSFKLLFIRYL